MVQGVTPYGDVRLCVAPEYGWATRAWTVEKGPESKHLADISIGEEEFSKWTAHFEVLEFAEFSGIYLPKRAELLLDFETESGQAGQFAYKYSIDAYQPMLADDRIAVEVPDQTTVGRRDKTGVRYEWQGERAVIRYSEALVARLRALSSSLATHTDRDEIRLEPSHTWACDTDDPYCGVYSLYAGAEFLGIESDIRDLVREEYLQDSRGSSVAELEKAASMLGLQTRALDGLSVQALRRLSPPAILHYRGLGPARAYGHFVLFAGWDRSQALIIDPAAGLARVPPPVLDAQWDGVALVLSPDDIPELSSWAGFPWKLIVAVASLGLALVVGHLVIQRFAKRLRLRRVGVEAASIVLLAAATALTANTYLIGNGSVGRGISALYRVRFMPTVSIDDLVATIASGSVIIDARFPDDYEAGHVPGAINIPTLASPEERAAKLSNVHPEEPIVVYCQSAGCKFDEVVADRLLRDGYANVAVFTEGWEAWNRLRGQQ